MPHTFSILLSSPFAHTRLCFGNDRYQYVTCPDCIMMFDPGDFSLTSSNLWLGIISR